MTRQDRGNDGVPLAPPKSTNSAERERVSENRCTDRQCLSTSTDSDSSNPCLPSAMSTRRPKGSGSVYEKTYPNGRTVIVAQRTWRDDTGRRRSSSGEGNTAEEALIRLGASLTAARASEATETRSVAQKPGERLTGTSTRGNGRESTLEVYADRWLSTRQVSATWNAKQRRTLEIHVYPVLGQKTLRSITDRVLIRFFDDLRRKSLGIQRNVYKALSTLLGHAERQGHITRNPIKAVDAPRTRRQPRQAEMHNRQTKLRGLLGWHKRDNVIDPCYYARIRLSLIGLRPSEALGLTWDNVVLTSKGKTKPHIVVQQQLARWDRTEKGTGYYIKPRTKTGDIRRIPLLDNTAEALRTWKLEQQKLRRADDWKPQPGMENLVLTHADGKPITHQQDQQRWQELLLQSQVNHAKPEIWSIGYNRHITTTMLLDAGTPQHIVATIMGHTAAVENAHYYHPQETAQRDALGQID